MSRDLDDFPTYDPVVNDDLYLSAAWASFMATFIETLQEYIGEHGVFVPRLTVDERDEIQEPQEGQMIYVSDANTPASPRTAELQIWLVAAGVGSWTVIV